MVVSEASGLRDVVDEILLENSNHNIAVMGDFNFDCNYISGIISKHFKELIIFLVIKYFSVKRKK